MPDADRSALIARYDALWNAAAPEVRVGRASVDPLPLRKAEDARRGVTLLARPGAEVAGAIAAFLDELRALEPAQYYQPSGDLHLTVLAPFTATVEPGPYLAHLDDYHAAAAEALAGVGPFAVDFTGVTMSTGAVLARGYPRDGTLELLRARLRAALTARGLGAALDGRYRLETAHLTLVRIASPLADAERFVRALDRARGRTFGTSVVSALELVVSDWYQSAEHTELVARYELDGRR